MLRLLLLCAALFAVSTQASWSDDDHDHDDHEHDADFTLLTYTSMIRLKHSGSGYHLHSHSINYGSGSGQQSVTAVNQDDDVNSLWQIRESYNEAPKLTGSLVQCGSKIRLMHGQTRRWLHSHLHVSPLTHKQEVTGYGDSNTQSDTGDDWLIECPTLSEGSTISMSSSIPLSFLHIDTNKRLYARRSDEFNNNNCRGCPIVGQLEISASSTSNKDSNAQWILTDSGIQFAQS